MRQIICAIFLSNVLSTFALGETDRTNFDPPFSMLEDRELTINEYQMLKFETEAIEYALSLERRKAHLKERERLIEPDSLAVGAEIKAISHRRQLLGIGVGFAGLAWAMILATRGEMLAAYGAGSAAALWAIFFDEFSQHPRDYESGYMLSDPSPNETSIRNHHAFRFRNLQGSHYPATQEIKISNLKEIFLRMKSIEMALNELDEHTTRQFLENDLLTNQSTETLEHDRIQMLIERELVKYEQELVYEALRALESLRGRALEKTQGRLDRNVPDQCHDQISRLGY